MIGSSAGVMAILIFICVYSPNYEIRILFFNIKLLYIGLFFVFFDIIQIPYGNAGGHFAHLGGSLVGFIYARQIKNGKDIFDSFSFLNTPKLAVGILYFLQMFFVKILEPSNCVAILLGPKTLILNFSK